MSVEHDVFTKFAVDLHVLDLLSLEIKEKWLFGLRVSHFEIKFYCVSALVTRL